jgi:hypothetical protein
MNGFYSDENGFYLVRDMVAQCKNKPVVQVLLTDLLHNIGTACWSNGLTPWKVVMFGQYGHCGATVDSGDDDKETEEYTKHWQRITDADLSYPLIVSADGWYNVLDGMHRLCKARQQGCQTVSCVLLSKQELRAIRRSKDELVSLLS